MSGDDTSSERLPYEETRYALSPDSFRILTNALPSLLVEVIASKTLIGTGAEAGADEDDFHTFRRKTLEITKEEKADDRRRKQQTVKVGAHSGVVKAFGRPLQKSHKVVNF